MDQKKLDQQSQHWEINFSNKPEMFGLNQSLSAEKALKLFNQKKIKNINIPVLVMHGEVDQIVPFWMGKKIYEIANQPKYSHFTKYDDHMMEYDEKLLFVLKTFIKSLN